MTTTQALPFRILDATSGWRQMWADKNCPFTTFIDIKSEQEIEESHIAYEKQRGNTATPFNFTNPTKQMDYRKTRFPQNYFDLIFFDPPQALELSKKSALFQKYGCLCPETWQSDFKQATLELSRILKPWHFLVFKWSSTDIPLSDILKTFPKALTLLTQQNTTRAKRKDFAYTWWSIFVKSSEEIK